MKIDYKSFVPVNPQIIKSSPHTPLKYTPLSSEKKKEISSLTDSFHSPCRRVANDDVHSKHVQRIEKEQSRADEVIEAIKLFRSLCSQQAQESLDDVLIDLYKRAGRIDEHIELLKHKLHRVEDGVYLCSIEHEKSRLLGNLGWAYMQQENYQVAEELYRKALSIEPDKNKECNLYNVIESIKSFRSLFSQQAQQSLDNVLIDLYKVSGRIGEHIELLQHKLQLLEDSGKKSICCSAEHEKSRLLGNLGWAYMQKKNYKVAVELYRKALSVEPDDKSNECSLAICFKQIERIRIAKSLLQSLVDGGRGLVHSNFRVSSYTTKVQQSGIRKCLDNSHPSKGQHQNHGFGRKWREEDPHLSSSSNSGKSWADMVEEEEEDEECSSLFSDCSAENMVESVSEWSSDDSSYMSQEDAKWNDKNEAVYKSDDNLSDTKDNLQWKFEEFRKPAARRSLYFDQEQGYEPSSQQYLHSNKHECAGSNQSTCSDFDSDSSGVDFPYDMDRFGETLKHELGDVKKGIKSVYVSEPTVHDKHKGGTVVIVFLDGSKLYVLSDSRLSYEFIHPETKVKDYRICYRTKGICEGLPVCEGLRVKLEEVGQKITACEGFISALAGDYKIAHHVCENLRQMWINEEIGSDHRFLVERLGDHSTVTDFVLATPTNAGGFEISSVTDEGVQPMVGRFLCLGSGRSIAETLIREKIKEFNGKTSSETVEILKEIGYEVCRQESTVGGVLTVAACDTRIKD
ncbi:hypothetical protein MKX03_018292 [Papaver bracteatum]|nr:hypothetical protein MKX03_018292 [Papaver bracteatum]